MRENSLIITVLKEKINMLKDHNKYFTKPYSFFTVSLLLMLFLSTYCSLPDFSEPTMGYCYIYGQVYNLSHPGPVPVGWTAPPLKQISTIKILDSNKKVLDETTTDSTGFFEGVVNPGTYYVSVKESSVQSETGPIVLSRKGDSITIKVYYDNGMR